MVFALVSLCVACVGAPPAKPNAAAGLKATLAPEGQTFASSIVAKLDCRIANTSDAAIEVDTFPFGSAILMLEVCDADGKRVPTIPPPMPPRAEDAAKYVRTLPPGEAFTKTLSLHVFSPPLAPGTYTARVTGMASNVVKFTIAQPKAD